VHLLGELAQVSVLALVLVQALAAHVPAPVVHVPALVALALVDLVVLVLVAQVALALVDLVVLVLVLVLVLVDLVAPADLVVLVLVAALAAAVLAAVPAAAVLVVRATVNVAHRVRNRVHVVVENLKNCSRSSRNTPTAMLLFQRAPSWWSVDLLHKNLHQS
jgi:hypothetical protein